MPALLGALEVAGVVKTGVALLVSVGSGVLLVVGTWAGPGAAAIGALLIFVGWAQRGSASRRIMGTADRDLKRLIRVQRGVGRQALWFGVALIPLAVLLPPLMAASIGAVGSLLLVGEGVLAAARTADEEAAKEHQPEMASEECWCLGRVAAVVATFPVPSLSAWFKNLAEYKVRAGQIGLIQFVTLCLVAAAFMGYSTMAIALGVRSLAPSSGPGKRKNSAGAPEQEEVVVALTPKPTYADDCPRHPDPLSIGHGLGKLFRRDGAVKAGCGSPALRVKQSGAWVAPGICNGQLWSLAISGPEGEPGLLYGEASEFAWAEARRGTLVGVETAGPSGGDVDFIRTMTGVYSFTRPRQWRVQGNEDASSCGEVGGEPERFTELKPPLVLYWGNLMDSTSEWIWPEQDNGGASGSVAFVGFLSGETVAFSNCKATGSCVMNVDGDAASVTGTAFTRIQDVATFMPPEEG